MSEQFEWESRRESYDRRVLMLCKRLNFTWYIDEKRRFLDRLCCIVGDPITGPDLLVVVPLYNREVIGRRRANKQEKKI